MKENCALYNELCDCCTGLKGLYCEKTNRQGIPEPAECHFFKDKEEWGRDEQDYIYKKKKGIFKK